MFSRAKTIFSLENKMNMKGEKYLSGNAKIQDAIGLRIVVYFSDDINVVELLVNNNKVVDRSIDEPDSYTFRPKRLNIVCHIPDELVEDFRKELPSEYAPYIDDTYEVQIRTIFSEGWHEVEHDMRYKCKEDWVGYESLSRSLNGVIATLETAEWSMQSIFHEMAEKCFRSRNYSAMLRNQLHIRIKGNGLSPHLEQFLIDNPDVAKAVHEMDRTVFVLSLLCHKKHIELTYDNILFLINRLEIHNKELLAMESEEQKNQIMEVLLS